MPAAVLNIVVEQGITFELAVRVKKNGAVLDISGYSGQMQIRNKPASETGSVVLGTGIFSVIDGPNGLCMVTIPESETANYSWTSGIYDFYIQSPSGSKYKILRGNAFLDKLITEL